MRNGLASDVLNSEMLYLMKLYQGTLDNPARLASTVELPITPNYWNTFFFIIYRSGFDLFSDLLDSMLLRIFFSTCFMSCRRQI
jgi:hypothetical protein